MGRIAHARLAKEMTTQKNMVQECAPATPWPQRHQNRLGVALETRGVPTVRPCGNAPAGRIRGAPR
eukprot:8970557-Lingulodinium_polyedra.AAC.1